jgi:hypothetical protein
LHFKCDVDTVGNFEGGIVVVYNPSIFEEAEIWEVEDFGLSFPLLLTLDVLAQTHGEEKGKDGELQDCTLEISYVCLAIFGNDPCRDGFLLMFLWVSIFVGLELIIIE